jgi:hypothetical protein
LAVTAAGGDYLVVVRVSPRVEGIELVEKGTAEVGEFVVDPLRTTVAPTGSGQSVIESVAATSS